MQGNMYVRKKGNYRPGNRREKTKILLLRMAVVCGLMVIAAFGVAFLFGGGKKPKNPVGDSTSTEQSDQSTASVGEIDSSGVPNPTGEPDSTEPDSTEPGKKKGIATDASANKVVDESYFDDALFIGNSRTEGFQLYSGLTNASFYASKGMTVSNFYTDKFASVDGEKKTILKALKNKKFGKIYIMLGLNEMGWPSGQTFVDRYQKIVQDIKKAQPEALIYIQSIFHVSKAKSKADSIYNNPTINSRNKLIQEMAHREGCIFLNVNEALDTEKNCLPADASTDGVHLNATYCKIWKDYLMNHTI